MAEIELSNIKKTNHCKLESYSYRKYKCQAIINDDDEWFWKSLWVCRVVPDNLSSSKRKHIRGHSSPFMN